MKSLLLYVSILMLLGTCSDDDTQSCGVSDPSTELQWLKQEIEYASASNTMASSYDIIIYQGKHNGRTVFVNYTCCPVCNTSPPAVRSCAGDLIGFIGEDIDYGVMEQATVIWRTNNGVCP